MCSKVGEGASRESYGRFCPVIAQTGPLGRQWACLTHKSREKHLLRFYDGTCSSCREPRAMNPTSSRFRYGPTAAGSEPRWLDHVNARPVQSSRRARLTGGDDLRQLHAGECLKTFQKHPHLVQFSTLSKVTPEAWRRVQTSNPILAREFIVIHTPLPPIFVLELDFLPKLYLNPRSGPIKDLVNSIKSNNVTKIRLILSAWAHHGDIHDNP
ncbi:hypothetical protein CROQUDRAFT_91746 [Cronartium quercuum f. sp. fusiforme G11]|uniref:Uncharacterized protein n=1 Tax=Cronartium quercuum f. sp. fusiforme G11 TaxID=708437 RepID=A0A9P6NN04_9BASI|nr:hypothetical protein CROQUDRAFT_91746 [Cronartium quercuum f. sp. fusiforme G11]